MDAWKLRNKFSDFIGRGKYAFAEYEKLKRITIPFENDKLIYITCEPEINHDVLIKSILKLIE